MAQKPTFHRNSLKSQTNEYLRMDVFDLRNRLVEDYANYTRSFITIADRRIKDYVEQQLQEGVLWPEPLLQLNPTFFQAAP